jgi:hypothetical protein
MRDTREDFSTPADTSPIIDIFLGGTYATQRYRNLNR